MASESGRMFGSGQMFQKLYGYIQGGNDEREVTKMTIPVFTFKHKNSAGMVDKISMCFWMNQETQVLIITLISTGRGSKHYPLSKNRDFARTII